MSFVPVHNHSEYSAFDGLSRITEIADRCEELGCPCCGLTDHGVVSGHLEFADVLLKRGIKPIFGCEFYHGVKTEFGKNERDAAHFVAGALTNEGLRNLWRLVDFSSQQENFRYVGRINWDALKQHSKGLFATSACVQGLVPKGIKNDNLNDLNQYLDIFGDNFYIELHTYPTEDQKAMNIALAEIGIERGLKFIYADDAHFASPDQYDVHDVYVAKSTGDSIYTPIEDRTMWHPKSLYIKSEDEIRNTLSYLPDHVVDEAISNSVVLGEEVDAQLPGVERHLPIFVPTDCEWIDSTEYSKDKNAAAELFIDLVEKGLEWRYGKDYSEEIFERANSEMEIFLEAGLEHYFLLAWDVGRFCDENNIERGPGRGSAAGCIIAYALGITDVDPLVYGLIFERFYNAGREKGFPDIDSDFPRESRKTIHKYLKDKWGHDRVRQIGTITRLKPKETLNSTYKVCGITFEEKEGLKKIIEGVPDIDILGPDSIGWSEESDPGKSIYVMDHVGEDIAKWIEDQPDGRQEIIYEWMMLIDVVCSRVEGYGMHPSGIVVSDVDLPEELPCALRGAKGTPVKDRVQATQFPMDEVDERQFIKLDILGLRNLDTLQEWKDHVDFDIKWSGLELRENPEEMWELLDKGLSLGIFQIEDGYAKRLCKDFKPRSVEDLAIIGSLNRPGPIRSGAPESFIARRHGYEEVTFDHPILEDILDDTYGWFLYQEQVIAFFNKLGYDLSESDAVRKILGKKKPEQMAALREGEEEWEGRGFFVMSEKADPSLTEKGSYTAKFGDKERTFKTRAELIWARLEDFAKYSFNKSHAIAYAVLGYRTLYAKHKAPHEFFLACIKTNSDDAGKYISEARRMGIEIRPPHILEGEYESVVRDNVIYLGFSDIKGVRKSGEYLIKLRDELGYDISTPELLDAALEEESNVHEEAKKAAALKGKNYNRKSPRSRLKRNQCATLYDVGAWDDLGERDISLSKKQALEKELLGVILSDANEQTLANNQDTIEQCDEYDDIHADIDWSNIPMDARGNRHVMYQLPGIISHIKTTQTRKDKQDMGIITLEHEGNDVEFAVFPREWRAYKFLWKERLPGIFTLKRNERGIHFNEGIKLS